MKWNAGLIAVASPVLVFLALTARAAAPVAEIGGASVTQGGSQTQVANASSQSSAAGAASTDTYYLLQSLRDELRVLRGMVEEQGNTIRLLKQRQVDDYIDLDRRLSGVAAGGSAAGTSSAGSANSAIKASTPTSKASTPTSGVSSSAGNVDDAEKAAYDKAYGVLKAGEVDAAKQAFKAYLAKYPKGRYVANGQYWLGEIYMLDDQLKEAGEAFSIIVEQYPAHRKMLDASFKLGKVYHLQGKDEKAKVILSRVAATKSSAGKLASNYLKANF
ncbi:MAG: hypothetical protein COA75_03760 [Cellvibrionales bacterium]|nr:MAG: hypothetical protein COA75_03760 [Cellvibrionales bacterium]